MIIPENLMKQLSFEAEKQGFGFAEVGGESFRILILGDQKYSPDEISVLAAYALLKGIVDSRWSELNEAAHNKLPKTIS